LQGRPGCGRAVPNRLCPAHVEHLLPACCAPAGGLHAQGAQGGGEPGGRRCARPCGADGGVAGGRGRDEVRAHAAAHLRPHLAGGGEVLCMFREIANTATTKPAPPPPRWLVRCWCGGPPPSCIIPRVNTLPPCAAFPTLPSPPNPARPPPSRLQRPAATCTSSFTATRSRSWQTPPAQPPACASNAPSCGRSRAAA
jgi:hypothetical protein